MHGVLKNIPVPRALRASAIGRPRKYPFEEMDVGDMFFVPYRSKNNMATHASTVGKQLDRKFATRLIQMIETNDGWMLCPQDAPGAVTGVGVWRMR